MLLNLVFSNIKHRIKDTLYTLDMTKPYPGHLRGGKYQLFQVYIHFNIIIRSKKEYRIGGKFGGFAQKKLLAVFKLGGFAR